MEKEKEAMKPADDAPKGLRFLVRVWGFIAALCMLSTGLFVLVTVYAKCLIAGFIQISAGLLVLCLEAPFLFSGFPSILKIGNVFEKYFKFWMRAFFYLLCAVPPPFFCTSVSTFVGCGSLGVLAAFYGMLAIGKKKKELHKTLTSKIRGGAVDGSPRKPASSRSDDVEMKAHLMTSSGEPNELNTY